MVRKAIQKFHLNFLSVDGLLSGTVLKVISDFREITQYSWAKVRQQAAMVKPGHSQIDTEECKAFFPVWRLSILGSIRVALSYLLLLAPWASLHVDILRSALCQASSQDLCSENRSLFVMTPAESGRQDWKPKDQFLHPPLTIKMSWTGFLSIHLCQFLHNSFISSTCGTRWGQGGAG